MLRAFGSTPQPAAFVRPAGVGVLVVVVKKLVPEKRSLSKPPKMNILFFIIAPPTEPPLNSSLKRGGPLSGLQIGLFAGHVMVPGRPVFVPCLLVLCCELDSASVKELRSLPKTLPCQPLVPDLVMMLTTEPELRPYSGPNWLVTITYCWTNSGSLTKRPGPPTLLSLLFWPSISWSLLRPRRPLLEILAPFVFEKLLLRLEATPGTKSASRSRPSFS